MHVHTLLKKDKYLVYVQIFIQPSGYLLQNFTFQDRERKKEIAALLGSVPDERYALLVNLGRKITDYSVDKDAAGDGRLVIIYFIVHKFVILMVVILREVFVLTNHP